MIKKIQTGLTREEFHEELSDLVCREWSKTLRETEMSLEELWEKAKLSNQIGFALYTVDVCCVPSWVEEANEYCKHMSEEILGVDLSKEIFDCIENYASYSDEELYEAADKYIQKTGTKTSAHKIKNMIEPIVRSYGCLMDINLLQQAQDLEFPFEFTDE